MKSIGNFQSDSDAEDSDPWEQVTGHGKSASSSGVGKAKVKNEPDKVEKMKKKLKRYISDLREVLLDVTKALENAKGSIDMKVQVLKDKLTEKDTEISGWIEDNIIIVIMSK